MLPIFIGRLFKQQKRILSFMRLQVLASGSSGNASFLELGGCRFLIDAGISCHRIESLLQKLAVKVTDLDGVFITHEHRDHVAGLATLYRKYTPFLPILILSLILELKRVTS